MGHICLPLQSFLTLWNGGAPAAASGFLMKMQGNRKQVQSRLTFPTALLRATMRHLSMIFSESGEWCGRVCPSLRLRVPTWCIETSVYPVVATAPLGNEGGWVQDILLNWTQAAMAKIVLTCTVYIFKAQSKCWNDNILSCNYKSSRNGIFTHWNSLQITGYNSQFITQITCCLKLFLLPE